MTITLIPAMTNPLGRHWDQPLREAIEIDRTHALMTEATLEQLAVYNCSIPTGAYEGKMWRFQAGHGSREGPRGPWHLLWFADDVGPDELSIKRREILIA